MITLKEKYKYFLNKKLKESKGADDISKPYKTPKDILDIMSKSAGDDSITTGWAERNTEEDQGRRRGAESVEERDDDVTDARKKELEASQSILKNTKGKINLPSDKVQITDRQYSNQEIADILNARGIFTEPRNKSWSKETVRLVGDKALEKLIAALKNK